MKFFKVECKLIACLHVHTWLQHLLPPFSVPIVRFLKCWWIGRKVRIQGHVGAALKTDSFSSASAADVRINHWDWTLSSMQDRILDMYIKWKEAVYCIMVIQFENVASGNQSGIWPVAFSSRVHFCLFEHVISTRDGKSLDTLCSSKLQQRAE